ncbi:MAG: hypothetical protein A2Z29_11670 [Chloroflexi bacterium RBG_16_56_11]|nr:MAG: hypothetical protein A2Z29_11670 [Chloroflexi bacterium RBG_16_56_11]
MKYVEFINGLIRKKMLETENIVLFGQNIAAGSCLSGLTKNLRVRKGLIINTQNSENTLCGIGFGLMISKVSSVFFMKQQDFLLLGVDHLANTYNFIRRKKPSASFTIMPVVIDQGYQGLQSSLNNFGDFCSLARVPGFAITNKVDAEEIINSQLVSPGFRIIGVSQRLSKEELIDVGKIYSNKEGTVFQYAEGKDATVVCFNFSFSYGWELYKKAKEKGIDISLFSVNAPTPTKWGRIIENTKETNKLVLIDDSKSENLSCYSLINDILDECSLENKILIKRDMTGDWLSPNLELLEIDYQNILEKIRH